MKLTEEVTFNEYMKPICLPQKGINFEAGKVCTVTGFGRIRKKGPFADTLLKTVLPIVDNSTCLRIYDNYMKALSRSDAAFCAGYGQGNTSFCKGDSEGPLACQKNGKFYLAGVVSMSKLCHIPSIPGVFQGYIEMTQFAVFSNCPVSFVCKKI